MIKFGINLIWLQVSGGWEGEPDRTPSPSSSWSLLLSQCQQWLSITDFATGVRAPLKAYSSAKLFETSSFTSWQDTKSWQLVVVRWYECFHRKAISHRGMRGKGCGVKGWKGWGEKGVGVVSEMAAAPFCHRLWFHRWCPLRLVALWCCWIQEATKTDAYFWTACKRILPINF